MMANCHHQRVSLLTLTFFVCLPCIVAIAALSVWPRLRGVVSSSSLQLSHQEHLQLFHHRTEADGAYFLSPGAASLRGRRPYQEDHLLCAPGIHVPYPASASTDLFGVFDGHLGDAASDFAARSITDRFLHHASLHFAASLNMSSMGLQWLEGALLAAISDIDAAFGKIAAAHDLKSGSTACVALQVHDQIIVANVGDSRAFFCSSCERQKYRSERPKHFHDPLSNHAAVRSYRGSRHHISRRFEDSALHSHSTGFCVKRLSADHRPDRPDEKLRIEASGGFVSDGSLPRVNGQLAISRSIGDIDFRKYGVISEPEVSGWHQVSENDKFLIVGSDGMFEKLSPEEVCDVLHALGSGKDLTWVMDRLEKNSDAVIALPGTNFPIDTPEHRSRGSSNWDAHTLGAGDQPLTSSPDKLTKQGKDSSVMTLMPSLLGAPGYAQILARILVEIAFRTGSMDNLSAVVVPLKA